MDEPFAALDEITRFKLNNDLLALWRELRMTVVFVTHSVFESVYLSSRIVVMSGRPGRVSSELAIDAPVRDANFRTSAEYARPLPHRLRGPGAGHARASGVRGMSDVTAADRREQCSASSRPPACWRSASLVWDLVVRINDIPPYILPGPGLVLSDARSPTGRSCGRRCWRRWQRPSRACCSRWSAASALAVLFNQSRLIEHSLYPYAVILQVTPVVAIAPLLLIYLPQQAAVLACAWIVAFFPVLANTTLGLNSVDHNLADLFRLYGASRWQVLCRAEAAGGAAAYAGRPARSPAACR